MRMRMITDDAMKVHFGLRLPDRTADHDYCHNYPGVDQAWELWHLWCWSSNYSNTLKDSSAKWMKLSFQPAVQSTNYTKGQVKARFCSTFRVA